MLAKAEIAIYSMNNTVSLASVLKFSHFMNRCAKHARLLHQREEHQRSVGQNNYPAEVKGHLKEMLILD